MARLAFSFGPSPLNPWKLIEVRDQILAELAGNVQPTLTIDRNLTRDRGKPRKYRSMAPGCKRVHGHILLKASH